MASSDNKKKLAELTALREKLNKAERRRDFAVVAEAAQEIITFDAQNKSMNILVFLYHKDLGEAHLKLLEYDKALGCFQTARDGLLHHRATVRLKYPEDWLNELKVIERLIIKTEKLLK